MLENVRNIELRNLQNNKLWNFYIIKRANFEISKLIKIKYFSEAMKLLLIL